MRYWCFILCFLINFCLAGHLRAFHDSHLPFFDFPHFVPSDTLKPNKKYRGFRLHLSDIRVLRKTDDWVRIQTTVVNTGKNNVDFGKKGTEHWVQFEFDNSLYESKLGGWKEQIRLAFFQSGFKLKAGGMNKNHVLKVETMPRALVRKTAPPESPPPDNTGTEGLIVFAAGDGHPASESEIKELKIQCPDLVIEDIRIVGQTKKWLTLEYTLANLGKGPLDLVERAGSERMKLAIRAHISGIPKLSKGALPIGREYIGKDIDEKDITLYPGDRHKEKIKLDIRKKTRYLNHLILSLETRKLRYECDRTNNTKAIELD